MRLSRSMCGKSPPFQYLCSTDARLRRPLRHSLEDFKDKRQRRGRAIAAHPAAEPLKTDNRQLGLI